MDRARHERTAKELDESGEFDLAIEMYQKSIAEYIRASKFTSSEEDKDDINNVCNQMTNRIKQIVSHNKERRSVVDESDIDDSDDIDDEEEKKNEDTSSISIQIISDTHLEFDGTYKRLPKLENKDNKASILALLGDIGYPKMNIYTQFIDEMSKKYKYILIITGNHEYYKDEIYHIHSILTELDSKYENTYFI